MASKTRLESWQHTSYQPYQFNHVAEFGTVTSLEDQFTGDSTTSFKPLCTLHFARRNQTVSDRYQAAGTSFENTFLIVIRHNKSLAMTTPLYVKIDDVLFRVITYSVNDDTYNSYDMLTLKHVDKVV